MVQVNLEIESPEALMEFIKEAKKNGYLKEVSMHKVETVLKEDAFPIRVPLEMDSVFKVMGNTIVRKAFGGKIDEKVIGFLLSTLNGMETG